MLRKLIPKIDVSLRRRQGIFEFCEDSECIFRLSVTTAAQTPAVMNTGLPAEARIIEMHFWNENMPKLPDNGPDLAYAKRLRRATVSSLREIAAYIQQPDKQDIKMLIGVTFLFHPGGATGAERFITGLGFSSLPYDAYMNRVHRFWENIYLALIMWTYNKATLRARQVFSMPRTLIWMTRDELLDRYGG